MTDVRFADILFILLASLVTFIILYLVKRGKQGKPKSAAETDKENNGVKAQKSVEDD